MRVQRLQCIPLTGLHVAQLLLQLCQQQRAFVQTGCEMGDRGVQTLQLSIPLCQQA